MKVFIGSDYRGFERKGELMVFLAANGYEVADEGAYEFAEGDDYNGPAQRVALAVREDPGARGILICGSAHGVTIQANRFLGIRAAHCDSVESAKLAREHDDANVLCLSAMFSDSNMAKSITEAFLSTPFEGLERRVRRINRLDEGEKYA